MRKIFITAAAAVSLVGAPALAQDTTTAETPADPATLAADPTTGDTATGATVDTTTGATAADTGADTGAAVTAADTTMEDTTMAATDATAMPMEREDDNDFPWGLLGLLGLAGLLGRNKRDTHVHHDTVHHDTTTRRDV